jgi:hypothetical protein
MLLRLIAFQQNRKHVGELNNNSPEKVRSPESTNGLPFPIAITCTFEKKIRKNPIKCNIEVVWAGCRWRE